MTWVTATVLNRDHPDFTVTDQVVDAVELKATNGRAVHIGEANAVNQCVSSEPFDGGLNFVKEIVAEALFAFIIPQRCFKCVSFSVRQLFDDECHGDSGGRGR